MKRKLNCVLLVDDDDATNFLHEMVVRESDITEEVRSVLSADAALEYLASKINGEHPQPDLIFLDINMPRMNGWEFLKHYKELPIGQKGGVVVVMLTTSLNPDDSTKATSIPAIRKFLNKPLTKEMINTVMEEHFKDYL